MKRLAMLALAALLGGCLGGGGLKENYYTLSSPPSPPPAAREGAPSVWISAVAVPEGVDRSPMVLRRGPNQVDIDDANRWAEPLKSAIPRVLAENLMRELGTARVFTGRGSPATQDADYRVTVDVQRFDSSVGEGATLDAVWTVSSRRLAAPRTGRSFLQEPAPSADPTGVAAAHSRALARLAGEIARAISAPPPSTRP